MPADGDRRATPDQGVLKERERPRGKAGASPTTWQEPGRNADRPEEIPGRGWLQIAKRVWYSIGDDSLTLVSAGIAFYAMLAIFPGLTALVAVYGLVADPTDVGKLVEMAARVLPPDILEILNGQLESLTGKAGSDLGWGVALSLAVLLWSASNGAQNLIRAVNLAYGERETRSFLHLRLLALVFTVSFLTFFVVALFLIAVLPTYLKPLAPETWVDVAVTWLRWPLMAAGILAALAAVYRYGPDRTTPRWPWVSWGTLCAGVLWLAGSAGFSFYVSRFGRFNETYGTLGAVIVLLLWLFLSAFVTLLGAEINSEMEHQTVKDSTTGPEKPFGQRDAYVADTVPRRQPED